MLGVLCAGGGGLVGGAWAGVGAGARSGGCCWSGGAWAAGCIGSAVAVVDSFVRVLWRWKEPEWRVAVGVAGEVGSPTGEVGVSRSLEPVESLVRFFFRKPLRVGMSAAAAAAAAAGGDEAQSAGS